MLSSQTRDFDDPRVPLSNLAEFFNTSPLPLELEYVFKFPAKTIVTLLIANPAWKEGCYCEQTVNFIGANNDIACYKFEDGKPTVTYYTKQSAAKYTYNNTPGVLLRLSTETPQPAQTVNNVKMYRIKNRLCIPILSASGEKEYRIDVTQVLTIKRDTQGEQYAQIKAARTELFGNMNRMSGANLLNKFIETCHTREIEFEVELLGQHTAESIDLSSMLKRLGAPLRNAVAKMTCMKSVADALKIQRAGVTEAPRTIKALTTPAITLSKRIYRDIYPPIGYYLTHKADGDRAILVTTAKSSGGFYLIMPDSLVTSFEDAMPSKLSCIFDCEVITSRETSANGVKVVNTDLKVLVFDVMMANGESVMSEPFDRRYDIMNQQTLPDSISLSDHSVKFEFKSYIKLDADLNLKRIEDIQVDFEIDGHILTSPNSDYRNTSAYKIKPFNTIDFVAAQVGKKWFLYSGLQQEKLRPLGIIHNKEDRAIFKLRGDYVPVRFAPSNCPNAYIWSPTDAVQKQLLEAAVVTDTSLKPVVVVELMPPVKTSQDVLTDWKFVQIRNDRIHEPGYFGNDFIKTAEVNWLICQDPLTLDSMKLPPLTYFAEEKSPIYAAQTKATSVAKSYLIRLLADKRKNDFVIDFASGNGQDLGRYIDAAFTSAMFIDQDKVALSELLARRYQMLEKRDRSVYTSGKFHINIGAENLNDPCDEVLARMQPYFAAGRPGTIVCNFAIHYFIASIDAMNNFIGLVTKTLADEGQFLYTTFDGQRVHELIRGGEWVDRQDDVVKYHIKKLYTATDFVGFDQRIAVKLPFSSTLYEENLVNVKQLNHVLGAVGFKVVVDGHFDDLLPQVAKMSPGIAKMVNDSDRHYMSLYYYCILSRSN